MKQLRRRESWGACKDSASGSALEGTKDTDYFVSEAKRVFHNFDGRLDNSVVHLNRIDLVCHHGNGLVENIAYAIVPVVHPDRTSVYRCLFACNF